MKVTKNKIFSVIIIIFLFSLFLYEINKLSFNPENITYFYDDRWPPCLELIKLGDLYNNQPMCFQGPVVYLIAYPFWILSEKYFQYMIFGLNFIFLLGTLFLILTIIRKKNIPLNILFIIFLFFLLIFSSCIKGPPQVRRRSKAGLFLRPLRRLWFQSPPVGCRWCRRRMFWRDR